MRLKISGTQNMRLEDLVHAITRGDLIRAREWVADAHRSDVQWTNLERPIGFSEKDLAIAAGLVELLATRDGAAPPFWAATVTGPREPFLLDPGLDEMPRSLARAKSSGPESLRKRNLIALPDFLKIA